jgi:hypothetical protein
VAGSGGAGILDSWQLAVVIIGATGMLASLLILCSHLIRLQQREEMEGAEDDLMEPMLLDEVGSVGSVDTSDEEEDDENEECECEEDEEVGEHGEGLGATVEQGGGGVTGDADGEAQAPASAGEGETNEEGVDEVRVTVSMMRSSII